MSQDYMKISNITTNSRGEIIKYAIDHIDRCRTNNSPENLRVITQSQNAVLTSNCISVKYNNETYYSLAEYCKQSEAGNYSNLQNKVNNLAIDDVVVYKAREYKLIDDRKIEVIDVVGELQGNSTVVEFNDVTYPSLKEFAEAVDLNYENLRKKVSRVKKDNVTEFTYKKFTFNMDNSGNINVAK